MELVLEGFSFMDSWYEKGKELVHSFFLGEYSWHLGNNLSLD